MALHLEPLGHAAPQHTPGPRHPGTPNQDRLELMYDGPIPPEYLEAAREADAALVAAWRAAQRSRQREGA